jgi:hypothetical protein
MAVPTMLGSSKSTASPVGTMKAKPTPATAADGAGTTSGPSLYRRTDLMGFNSTWWMAVVWLIVTVLVVSPYPWWW